MNSYMRYRPSQFAFMIVIYGEIIFVSDEICAKMTQKPNYKSKEIQILGENEISSKLKHRKAHNLILSGRFVTSTGDREIGVVSGRLLDNPGGQSWHVCIQYNVLRHTTF